MIIFRMVLPIVALAVSFLATDASADIFRYTDANGTVHFADRPAKNRYKLYIKTKQRKSSKRARTTPRYTRYESIIRRASLKHGVKRKLIKSVIEIESAFDSTAISKSGAAGLMQLMPITAKKYGVKNRFSPSQNIEAGTKHLKYLLKRYKGDIRLALAAYNAGEDAVKKYSGMPPYTETQNYVELVTGLYYGRTPKLVKRRNISSKQKVYRYVDTNGVLIVTDTPLTKPIGYY